MHANDWAAVKELFHAARAMPKGPRAEWLRARCEGDSALIGEVQALLYAHEQLDGRMEPPAAPPGLAPGMADGATALADKLIGSQVGRYTLTRVLGYGGMGTVYEAEQDVPRRRVALKIVRGGSFVDQRLLKLFRREVQALAMLTHPGIAALYDSGRTEDGQHYFAMELVEGEPLTGYARRHDLSIDQRLELFAAVCDAVAYAHNRGIIHRDLKPSNILVDAEGRPRVLDFGLARITDRDVALTTVTRDVGKIQGTLAYMSPEQARGSSLEIDVRSDTYSLGVLLFELLTGELPYDVRGAPLPHAVRLICEEPPRRPSSIRRVLRGDLETIALKSLEKDSAQRYQSAVELAADLRRFLNGELILARPHSVVYHLRKIVQRHRVPFALAAALLVLLVAFAVTMTVQSYRIAGQRDRAEKAENAATAQLWQSYLSQAKALRVSGRAGQRFEALEAIRKAAAIRPGIELRNEAIACMALFDVRLIRPLLTATRSPTVAFSSGFEQYAIYEASGHITIHRVADDALVARLKSGSDDLVKLSPDGQWAATTRLNAPVDQSEGVRVWNIDRAVVQTQWHDATVPLSPSFTFDSSALITGHPDRTVRIREVATGAERMAIKVGMRPDDLAPSADGRWLAVHSWRSPDLQIWNIADGTLVHQLTLRRNVSSATFDPSARLLAVGCDDLNVHVYDTRTWQIRHVLRAHEWGGIRARFSHSGRLLATWSWDGTSQWWDVLTGRPLVKWIGGSASHFSPDDRVMYYYQQTYLDARQGLLELRQPEECRTLADESDTTGPMQISISPCERILTSTHAEGVRFWRVATGAPIAQMSIGEAFSAVFDRSGEWLVTSGERGLIRWPIHQRLESVSRFEPDKPFGSAAARPQPQQLTLRIGPPEVLLSGEPFRTVALSADGRRLVAGCKQKPEAICIDLSHIDRVQRLAVPNARLVHVAISPDGRWVAAAGTGGQSHLRIFDTMDGKQVFQPGMGGLTQHESIEFSSDSRRLLANNGRDLAIWECGTWREISRRLLMDLRKGQDVASTSFDLDSRSRSFGLVRLIEPEEAAEVAAFQLPRWYDGFARLLPTTPWMAHAISAQHCILLWDLRRVRDNLADMGLDWDAPPYPPRPPDFEQPITIEIDLGDFAPQS